MSVADINARLKDRYKILTGGARVLQERQQTLRALVDWSYDLLSPPERTLLARLGVFVGGFDLAAAEEVCGSRSAAGDDVLDLLASLVEKSLVMLEEREKVRATMLETIREYAREKLEQDGELRLPRRDTASTIFAMAKQATGRNGGPSRPTGSGASKSNIDNVRSAMAFALDGGADPFIAVKMAVVAMQGFWMLRGYSTEGRKLVRRRCAWPRLPASDLAQAWALYVGAGLAESQSDYAEARKMLETCLVAEAAPWESVRHRRDAVDTFARAVARRRCGCGGRRRARGAADLPAPRRSPGRSDRPVAPGPDRQYLGDDEGAKSYFEQAFRSRERSSTRNPGRV